MQDPIAISPWNTSQIPLSGDVSKLENKVDSRGQKGYNFHPFVRVLTFMDIEDEILAEILDTDFNGISNAGTYIVE